MKRSITFVGSLVLLGFCLTSPAALAYCVTSGTSGVNANIPTIKIPRDLAVGQPIPGVTGFPTSGSVNVSCVWGMNLYLKFGTTMTQSSIPGVYNTNIAGIGVKLTESWGNNFAISNNYTYWYTHGSNAGAAYTLGVSAQFYLTGPVAPGKVLLPSTLIEAWASDGNGSNALYGVMNATNPIAVEYVACETPDITVDMDKHTSDEFTGKGTTSHTVKFDFRIDKCGSGMNTVSYTLKPAAGIELKGTGTGQYLTLNSASTAQGLGLQVLYDNNTLVPFNTKIKYTGYNTATPKSYAIPMKARYIQTDTTFSGGSANTALEVTMLYE